MKKLIPATIMLLVAAILMSTASFAWFSMNTTVTATGMSIKASVPTQLLIKGSQTSPAAEYKSAIDFTANVDSAQSANNSLLSVPPVAYKSSTGTAGVPGTFYKLTNGAYAHVKTNGYLRDIYDENGDAITAYTDFTKVYLDNTQTAAAFTTATAHTDYLQDTFSLKYAGELSSNDDVKVTITVTTTDTVTSGTLATDLTLADNVSPIYKAVHVVFVQGSNAYEVDLGTATIDTAASSVSGTTANVVFKCADIQLAPFTASNQELPYTMYIFYDGEDSDCINDNAINMENFNFDLKFELYAA